MMKKLIKLGKDYPYPIVNHEKARLKALGAFKKFNLYITVTMFKFFSRSTWTFFVSTNFFKIIIIFI